MIYEQRIGFKFACEFSHVDRDLVARVYLHQRVHRNIKKSSGE